MPPERETTVRKGNRLTSRVRAYISTPGSHNDNPGSSASAVCPGPTLTPMILRNPTPERTAAVIAAVPLGRWIQPLDIANVVEFLAGARAAMCTGTSIEVDGGVMVSNGSRYEDYFAART